MSTFLRYRDDLEKPEAAEAEQIQTIIDLHLKAQHSVREKYGVSVRASHAKAHGFAKGKLIVAEELAPEFKQGLFARPGTYDVVVRFAQVPGETLDDRSVSTPRGFAIKVFGVEGEKIPQHNGETTQDWVLNEGKAFFSAGLAGFIATVTPNTTIAPKLPETVKGVVSHVARATNAALSAVGMMSNKLDLLGHPPTHPLGASYYSQVPFRYGEYVAKLGVVPGSASTKALEQTLVKLDDENAVRKATVDFFRENEAVFDLKIQLGLDEKVTPIEDASVEWPEEQTPYVSVAQIVLPAQDAFSDAMQDAVDYNLSFSPAHALAAFRPLGAIMRARLATYPVLSIARRTENKRPTSEPESVSEISSSHERGHEGSNFKR